MTLYVAAILILLALSATASGTETAVTGASPARVHQLAEGGHRRAKILLHLLEDRERLVSTILLSNNIFNIMAAAFATDVLLRLFGDVGVAYATFVMTALIVVFAEVLPKTYAIRNAETFAIVIAPFARFAILVLYPFTTAIGWLVRWLIVRLGLDRPVGDDSAGEHLRGTIAILGAQGLLAKHDRDMLKGVLELEDTTVADIMTHRRYMVTLDADTPILEAIAFVRGSAYTRIPLWRGSHDHIIGILHKTDMLNLIDERGAVDGSRSLDDLMVPAWFVPETTALKRQLEAFREKNMHLAMVVDEYGSIEGLVTLEDILEEIVGQITDEKDIEPELLERLSPSTVSVAGTVSVADLNREMDWQLEEEKAVTVAGLVVNASQRIPKKGESIVIDGYRIDVLERQGHRLSRLRVERLSEEEARS